MGVLERQAINQNRLMLSFLTGRAGFREKPDSTFSPGALNAGDGHQRHKQGDDWWSIGPELMNGLAALKILQVFQIVFCRRDNCHVYPG